MEEWRDVVGYEGLYQVSNLGKVKSYHNKNGRGLSKEGHILSPKIDKDGYHEYGLSNNRNLKYKRGHRLVAEAFIPNLNNLPQVNHINGIKSDNRVENLEWIDNRGNIQHAWDAGLKEYARKVASEFHGYKCKLIHIKTNEEIFFNSHSQLSLYIGFNRHWLSSAIRNGTNFKEKCFKKGYYIVLEWYNNESTTKVNVL